MNIILTIVKSFIIGNICRCGINTLCCSYSSYLWITCAMHAWFHKFYIMCMLIMFFVNCMQYTLPFAEPSRMIPGVNGFLVNISNQQSNKNVSTFLNDSDARSYVFSSTSLQQAGLEGVVITIVTVVTEVGRFHNNLTFSCEFMYIDIVLSVCMLPVLNPAYIEDIPYSAKFSRGLIFADFVGWNSTRKLSPRKVFINKNYLLSCKYLKAWLPVSSHSANIVQRNGF